jgi:hypothetical protein
LEVRHDLERLDDLRADRVVHGCNPSRRCTVAEPDEEFAWGRPGRAGVRGSGRSAQATRFARSTEGDREEDHDEGDN